VHFKFDYQKPKVVAEIGCNHMGNMKIAKELIALAKECGACVAKFQTRDNKLLLTEEQYNAPHPVQDNKLEIINYYSRKSNTMLLILYKIIPMEKLMESIEST